MDVLDIICVSNLDFKCTDELFTVRNNSYPPNN